MGWKEDLIPILLLLMSQELEQVLCLGSLVPSLCPSHFILKNMSKEAVRSGVKGAGGRVSSFPGALSGVKQSRKSLTLTTCANTFFRPLLLTVSPSVLTVLSQAQSSGRGNLTLVLAGVGLAPCHTWCLSCMALRNLECAVQQSELLKAQP